MTGIKLLHLVGLAALGSASALRAQQPLLTEATGQTPLAGVGGDADGAARRPLVDSDSFQARIKSKNLLSRAKDLYGVAELSYDEYNRPTRVIGSQGTRRLLPSVSR